MNFLKSYQWYNIELKRKANKFGMLAILLFTVGIVLYFTHQSTLIVLSPILVGGILYYMFIRIQAQDRKLKLDALERDMREKQDNNEDRS